MAESVEELKKQIKIYIWVFVALGVLTGITVWVAYIDIPHPWNLVVGLSVAVIKASLVALFFMHLLHERRLIYRVLAFTFFFFLAMMFLCILSFHSHITIG